MNRGRIRLRRVVVAAAAGIVMALVGVAPASAHPLGNFSINHLDQLSFERGRIVDNAIVDTAEIPTAQAADIIDTDHNGKASDPELAAYGVSQCASYLTTLTLTVDSVPVTFSTTSTTFTYRPGQAGLPTTRLECTFVAAVDLSAQRSVVFANSFAPNRVGWHEITAVGNGSRIEDSPVPTSSVTKGLTVYPVDLLSSPMNVRDASFTIVPGSGASTQAVTIKQSASAFSRALGPFSRVVDRVTKTFNDLVGRKQLTLGIGLLAIGLALILGMSHALLPGHGKTVMAAYIAGRQGSVKDAVLVGATVTATHTGGVLILGLALTLSTSLAGESVLAYLGVISGLMIAALGASLLRGAHKRRQSGDSVWSHGHSHGGHSHTHRGRSHSHDAPTAVRVAAAHSHSDEVDDHEGAQAHEGAHAHGGASHSHGGAVHSHGGAVHSHGGSVHSHGLAKVLERSRRDALPGASPVAQPAFALAGRTPLPQNLDADAKSSDLAGAGWNALSVAERIADVGAVGSHLGHAGDVHVRRDLLIGAQSDADRLEFEESFENVDGENDDHEHADHSFGETKIFSRKGLIGMGIAGGLVPSPSALVVLLSAIALGRTIFGIVLVVGYGIGMAGTLTLAGVLLVRVRDRYQGRAGEQPGRLRALAQRWTKWAPYLTAGLVFVVGLGLALRSLGQL